MVLKSPYTGHQRKGCGWPRKLRWVAHPVRRAPLQRAARHPVCGPARMTPSPFAHQAGVRVGSGMMLAMSGDRRIEAMWSGLGEGEQRWFLGTLATIRVSGEAVDGRFALIEFL